MFTLKRKKKGEKKKRKKHMIGQKRQLSEISLPLEERKGLTIFDPKQGREKKTRREQYLAGKARTQSLLQQLQTLREQKQELQRAKRLKQEKLKDLNDSLQSLRSREKRAASSPTSVPFEELKLLQQKLKDCNEEKRLLDQCQSQTLRYIEEMKQRRQVARRMPDVEQDLLEEQQKYQSCQNFLDQCKQDTQSWNNFALQYYFSH
jgi:hypothetical protein